VVCNKILELPVGPERSLRLLSLAGLDLLSQISPANQAYPKMAKSHIGEFLSNFGNNVLWDAKLGRAYHHECLSIADVFPHLAAAVTAVPVD
jgi:hypothetical protein